MRAAFEHGPPTVPWRQPVARHPRPGGTGSWAHRWSPGSAAQHQGAPTASGPGAVCSSRGATRTGSAGPARRARHCPKAIRAHGACRRPGTTPSQPIPAAGDADRDHIGDAVEAQARPGADSRCRAAAVRRWSNVPASSIASVCSASSAVMSASLMRAPPGAARQCRAGVVMEHSEQVGPRRSAARCRRSSRASSAPCSLNNTTNGPNHAATSASTSSANPATTNTHHQNRRPTRRH